MHVHTLRKTVRPVGSLQETEWENAEVLEMPIHLSSLVEASVHALNTLCLSFTAISLEKRQESPSNSPFNAAECKAFEAAFHTPQDNREQDLLSY